MTLCGIDTEYGFTVEGRGVGTQADDSIALVRSSPDGGVLHWDYRDENPRRDMRGFQVEHLAIDPEDARFDAGRARPPAAEERSDRVLANGARFYNDHGHPEYATPECWTLKDLVGHEQWGDHVVLRAAQEYKRATGLDVRVYKNNTDFHGASWGTHESYLVPRSIPFAELARAVMPVLIARQVVTGAGKVGSESRGPVRYQISQRADFFVEPMNVETLYRRPVFNTRDEPHGDAGQWRRLHVICGDSNRHPGCTLRKVGLIQIALELLKKDLVPKWDIPDPVQSFQLVSRDATGGGRIDLEGRNWTTPRQVLESYCLAVQKADLDDQELVEVASESLALLEARHRDPDSFWPHVDWAAKLWLLEQFATDSGWDQSTMQALDMQYHLLDPAESLYSGLVEAGYLALPNVKSPPALPQGSRARVRAAAVQKLAGEIESLSWGRIRFKSGQELTLDPSLWYTAGPEDVESVGDLFSVAQP